MALGRVRPICLENLPEGGLYTATGPTELDPKKDAVDAGGYFVQSPTGPAGGDTSVLYGRTGSVAQVTDTSGALTMAQTVSVSGAPGGTQHPATRDMSHFLGAPSDGFASGATQVFAYVAGTGQVASMTWYTSTAQSVPIYSEVYTYNGAAPASAVCKTYDASGNVLATVTETYQTTAGQITQVVRTH